jgi:hypothetical protein
VDTGFPKDHAQSKSMIRKSREPVFRKACLGLDPRDHAQTKKIPKRRNFAAPGAGFQADRNGRPTIRQTAVDICWPHLIYCITIIKYNLKTRDGLPWVFGFSSEVCL